MLEIKIIININKFIWIGIIMVIVLSIRVIIIVEIIIFHFLLIINKILFKYKIKMLRILRINNKINNKNN